MMVTDKNVAYLGVIDPDHIPGDMDEIKAAGCTSITLTVNEMDWWYYRTARKAAVKEARERGIKVYLDFHGFGIFASPIPSAVYPMYNPDKTQVFTDGRRTEKACPNDAGFETWFKDIAKQVIEEFRPDGIFWDEPAFSPCDTYPKSWACFCKNCQEKFKSAFGKPMPKELTDEVQKFRQDSLLEFLTRLLKFGKEAGGKTSILCMMPWSRGTNSNRGWYGILDWEPFIQIPEMDVFATDPYWIHGGGWNYFTDNTREAVELCGKYKKPCQLWVQAVWIKPGKEPEVKRTILEAAKMGADMIAVWSYKAEPGAHVLDFGGDHKLVWQMVKDAFPQI